MRTEVTNPEINGFGGWHTLEPNDDVTEWVGFLWHGVFMPYSYPHLESDWFEVEL
jgi:hypothetical protein